MRFRADSGRAMRKRGQIVLTFIEERRQRIRKAREEGRAEAFAEILEIVRRDPRIDDEIRNDPETRKALRNLGIELPD